MLHIHTLAARLVAAGGSVILLSLCAITASCAREERQTPASALLRVGFGMEPSIVRENAVTTLRSLLYAEGLVTHDWAGHPGALLAESWNWSGDRRTLHLQLKKNVVFHDASPVTAATVVRSLRQVMERRTRLLGFTYVTAIETVGELSIDIHLSRPDAFLVPELSDLRLTHPDNDDVGTGPFRLVRRDPVESTRFDQYHGGAPALSGVKIAVYDSQRSAWAALMNGDVDVVQEVSRESVDFMRNSSRLRPFSTVQPFYVPIFLNHSHPALRNREVRLAMLEALDRRALIEQAMNGFGQITDDPVWPQHWAYSASAHPHGHDPAAARARLDRAGFPVKPRPEGPDSRFSFRCVVLSEEPQSERIALMVQRQMSDVGIDMGIEMVSLKDIGERAGKGDFDGLLARANSSRTLNFLYQFWRSATGVDAPFIKSGYTGTNQAFDRLRAAGTTEETRAAVEELVGRFHHDVPALFIAWVEVTRAVDTRFSVGDGKVPDPFINLRDWRLAGQDN
jgi:peptide/nickel transport system substrate-binding protein